MATLFFSLLLISCSLIQSFVSVTSLGECSASCGDGGPAVQFPFSLTNTWADGCGHISRYGLRCENSTRQVQPWLILDVPTSGEFVVNNINYTLKTISINDPGGCLPRRFLGNFTPPTYPFWITTAGNWYTFLNCTANFHIQEYAVIACLSDENFTVLAAPLDTSCPRFSCVGINMAVCKVISVTYVPFEVGHPDDPSFGMNFNQDIMLAWDPPSCAACELRGGTCGFNKSSDDSIGCLHVHSHGLPRAAKYGLILGAGIPGLLCLIGLMCFVSRRIRTYHRRSEPTMEFSAMAGPRPMLLSVGLDGPTIESYPMTQLGESKRLPKPNDNTCSICLCEYQPKETLRTIPECNHYFHVNCIDEWLRLNASCPLCRNLPEPSLQEMPSSSLSSSTALAPPA
ncbi:RING-H2 finger protein ATL20-like isoform X2 [Punica granatum]|uniref:RING-type E3 ubiquitin transferase n=1 Tax=Punica granatum TaxID=22663 RepID=A0A6P8BY69_PUNGR|nr:RING-H2 finger protein ATL20-like isoform X2 [Punica granatum]